MFKKPKKKLLKIPTVVNSRFLLALLKIIVHGELSSSKLTMIHTLLKMIDIQYYSKDPEVFSILKALEMTINCKFDDVKDNHLITSLIEASISNPDNEETIKGMIEPIIIGKVLMPDQEISMILNVVSTYSKIGFILDYQDSIVESFRNIESGSVNGINTVVDEFEKQIAELHMKLHKTLSNDGLNTSEPVSINDPDFSTKFFKTVFKMSKRKTRALRTGLKKFNEFLSDEGGFLTGKMYVVNAPTNSFKTGLLLYIAKWIQLYNGHLYLEKYKENGKRPTVLVVSLENTWDENTERLFSMYVKKNMGEISTLEEAEDLWKQSVYSTNSIVDICMIYGKAGRFSPSDLEYRIDELESRGCVVIATIVDYMRIMRDDLANPDPRVKTINIATDLHEIVAMRPEMVLVTAHHTNRDGDKLLTDVEERGGVDKVKGLGRQHLTEAHGVEDAIDFSLYIAPEVSIYTGESFLGFKKGKCRYKRTPVEYFAHQLVNRFYLTDDLLGNKSLSVDSIAETAGVSNDNNTIRSKEIRFNRGGTKNNLRSNTESVQANAIFSSDDLV